MNWKKSTLQEQWRLWMGVNVTLDGTACWPRSIAWKKKHFGPKIFPIERWSKSARKLQRILRNRDQVQVKHLDMTRAQFFIDILMFIFTGKSQQKKNSMMNVSVPFPRYSTSTRTCTFVWNCQSTARDFILLHCSCLALLHFRIFKNPTHVFCICRL